MITLEDIKNNMKSVKCDWCHTSFDPDDIYMYPHPGGHEIKDVDGKQWVYVKCKNCEYDWAIK